MFWPHFFARQLFLHFYPTDVKCKYICFNLISKLQLLSYTETSQCACFDRVLEWRIIFIIIRMKSFLSVELCNVHCTEWARRCLETASGHRKASFLALAYLIPTSLHNFSQRVGMFSHSDALIPSYPLSTIFTNIFHTITVTEVVCICGPPKASRGDVILTLIITSPNQPLSTVSWNILHRVTQVAPFSILILSEQKYFGTEFFWHRKQYLSEESNIFVVKIIFW